MFSFKNTKKAIKPIAEISPPWEGNKFLSLYRKEEEVFPKGYFDEITLPKGHKFEFMPETREDFVDRISMSASSGAGKTTTAVSLIKKIMKVLDLGISDVYICLKTDIADKALESLDKKDKKGEVVERPNYIFVDDEFLENPPTIDEIANDGKPKILLIDDCDNIQSKKLQSSFIKFQNDSLERGRKVGIYVIVCAHRMCSGVPTKALLTESTYFLFFPKNMSSDYKYCLNKYADMSNSLIADLKKTNSDWVLFYQHSPKFILTERQCKIFDLDREEEISKVKLLRKKKLIKEQVYDEEDSE